MSLHKDVRPVDRVPCELGTWITPLNTALPPLGDDILPPLPPGMISASYYVAKAMHKMMREVRNG